jgi:hypothetical protein
MGKAIALLLAVCLSIPAHAGFLSGNMLLSNIQSDESFKRAYAIGFILGVHDVYEDQIICSGANVTGGQLRDIVKKFLENNPSERDLPAHLLVMISLGKAFPCKSKSKS